jgi:hypothetical protein
LELAAVVGASLDPLDAAVVAGAAVVAASPAVVPEDVPLSSEHAAATRPSATTPAASLKLFLTVDSPLSWMAVELITGSGRAESLGGEQHPVTAVIPGHKYFISQSICRQQPALAHVQPLR